MKPQQGTNRRTFIKGAAGAAATLAASPRSALAATPTPVRRPDSLVYSEAAWRALVGDRFRITGPHGRVVATLTAVTGFPPPAPGGSAFGLRFTGPAAAAFEQATFAVYHDLFGSFELFLTDGGEIEDNRAYVAMVNRLTP